MAPWKQNQSYMHDMMDLRYGALEDGVLEFKKKPIAAEASTRPARAEPVA
jgi:hypothetical protein